MGVLTECALALKDISVYDVFMDMNIIPGFQGIPGQYYSQSSLTTTSGNIWPGLWSIVVLELLWAFLQIILLTWEFGEGISVCLFAFGAFKPTVGNEHNRTGTSLAPV